MPVGEGILLVRVDDRLLHGQVALGWGGDLNPRTYVLVDDRLHDDPVESEIYRSGAPEGSAVRVDSVRGFLSRTEAEDAAVVLVRDLESLDRLVAGGFRPPSVNLGGLHTRAGAEEILPFLFLRPLDWELLERMTAQGVAFFAQDLPTHKRRPWLWLIERRAPKAGA